MRDRRPDWQLELDIEWAVEMVLHDADWEREQRVLDRPIVVGLAPAVLVTPGPRIHAHADVVAVTARRPFLEGENSS